MADTKGNKVQRIKLRIEGSPVKFDGTIIEASPDGKRIVVEFDGPLETAVLYAYGKDRMVSDMKDRDGKPTENYRMAMTSREWEVL